MIGELHVGFQTRTVIWNFFTKLTETYAECNYCHGHYNYGTTKSHLLKHVRRKHPEAIQQFKKGKILPPVPHSDEISRTSLSGVEVHEADESQNGDKGADKESSSDVWSLFTRMEGGIAKCNLCEVELSCKYSITDLTKHWKTEHLGVLLKCDPSENEPAGNGLGDIPAEENCSSIPQISKASSSNDEPAARNVKIKLRKSPAWKYFTKLDTTYASCNICRMHFSYVSISNLMRHIVRKHPCQLVASARNGKQEDIEEDDDLALEPEDQSTVSDVEEGSEGVSKIGKKRSSHTRGSDELPELRRSKRMRTVKIESEDVSMDENLQSSQDQEDNITTAEDEGIGLRSYVWQVFTKLENGFAQCKICGATMSKRSSVSNLCRHVNGAHPSFVSAMQKKLAAIGNGPSGESGRCTPVERAETSDDEGAEPPTAGDDSDGAPSDEPESEERNQASQVGQTESGGAKPNQRKRAKRKGRSKSKRAKSGRRKSEERNQTSESGGAKPNERSRANGNERSETERAKSGRPKAGERDGTHRRAEDSQPDCLLSERFTSAVEEGNRLMRDLQEVVQRQGRALDRIAACLEGMSRLPTNNA